MIVFKVNNICFSHGKERDIIWSIPMKNGLSNIYKEENYEFLIYNDYCKWLKYSCESSAAISTNIASAVMVTLVVLQVFHQVFFCW